MYVEVIIIKVILVSCVMFFDEYLCSYVCFTGKERIEYI